MTISTKRISLTLFFLSWFSVPSLAQELFQNPGFEDGTVTPFQAGVIRGSLAVESNASDVFAGSYSLRHQATDADSYILPWYGTNVVSTGGVDVTMQLTARVKASQANTQVQLYIFSLDQNQQPQVGYYDAETFMVGTDWVEVTFRFDCPSSRPYASMRLDNDGGNGVTVWWDNVSFFEVDGVFPEPPGPYTNVAVQDGNWHDPNTWDQGLVPDNGAIVSIPAARTVVVRSQEDAVLKFIDVEGNLSSWIHGDSRLRFDTLYVAPGGTYRIGYPASTLNPSYTAELIVQNDGTDIDTVWDPQERSRGIFAQGSFYLYGAPKTHMGTTTTEINSTTSSVTLASAPTGWQNGDQIVIAGTQFQRGEDLEDDLVGISGLSGASFNLSSAPDHRHIPMGSYPIHIANVSRNIVISSESSQTPRRGHVMFRSNDVDVRHAAFIDLGRTDKSIPLDEVIVEYDCDSNPMTDDYCVSPNPDIENRRGRYAVHFHLLGADPNQTTIPQVIGSVVQGVIGWGFVNHGSYVDFSKNVAYDFAGAGFVTEFGNELGSFIENIAIRGTGVEDTYFDARQVFANLDRPQPLSDFAFGGDGFWFQGPALTVVDNVASSCNGAGMFWFGTGAVDIANNHYVGFPTAHIDDVYGHFTDYGSHQYRTWNYTGSSNDAVIADLPILECSGVQAYACLVGLHVRFTNHKSISFYGESPFSYNSEYTGSFNQMRQTISDVDLWNNETGLRIRYIDETDWSDVDIRSNRDRNPKFAVRKGAELVVSVFDQDFFNLNIDGYETAGQLNGNGGEVTFSGQTYTNYVNTDTWDGVNYDCEQITGVTTGTVTSTTAVINWDPPSSTTFERFLVRYRIQDQAPEWQYHTETTTNATTTTLTGLTTGTYEYQVIAGCDGYHQFWHSKKTFVVP